MTHNQQKFTVRGIRFRMEEKGFKVNFKGVLDFDFNYHFEIERWNFVLYLMI